MSCILLFTNLEHSCLWQDEAQSALISRTIVMTGLPRGTDGVNFFSNELGAEYGPDYIWRWHSWLHFYVLAATFAIFGESTFIARLPFAACGVLTILATYRFTLCVWNARETALIAALLLVACIPFLLLSRQCRYYSMAALFTVTTLDCYWRLLRNEPRSGVYLGVSLQLLFHTHYVYAASVLPALLSHALVWRRERLRVIVRVTIVFCALILPWLIWFGGMQYSRQYGARIYQPHVVFGKLNSFLAQLDVHIMPTWVLVVPLLAVGFCAFRSHGIHRADVLFASERMGMLLLTIVSTLVVLAVTAPAAFFRYLAPLLPCLIVVIARVIVMARTLHWVFGPLIVVVLVSRQPISDYLYELTHQFSGPIEGTVEYLNARSRHGDVVATTHDMPLKFYTGLRVIGGMSGESIQEAAFADWIIIGHAASSPYELPLRTFLLQQLRTHRYEKTVLECPDTIWENREDPSLHLYRSVGTGPRVVVWHRLADKSEVQRAE